MPKNILELLLIAAIVGVCVSIVAIAESRDRDDWQRFIVENECRVIAKTKGQTVTTTATDSNGKTITGYGTTKSTTTWRCADGIDYTR